MPDRRRVSGLLLCALAAAALVIGAYWNSLGNAFHFDDSHVIENNLYIRSLHNVPRFFTDATTFSSIRSHASYRPLLSLTLALDYARGGLDPRPYHRTQIGLLVGLGALLVFFYTRLLRDAGLEAPAWAALAAATFFCVHTANTETLNLISARSEELAVIGTVAGFLVWFAWPRLRASGLHLVPVFIGALAKIHTVMYGPLLFAGVWVWQPEGTSVVQRTRRAIAGTWAVVAGSALIYLFIRRLDAPEWTAGGGGPLPYAWTQPWVWLHYARLFVLPVGLTADSDWSVFPAWYDTRALIGYTFVALLVTLFFVTARRRATGPIAFGIAWFVLSLLPTSSVIAFAEVVNEHRVFFPFVGLALAAAAAIDLALGRTFAAVRVRRLAASALVLALLAAHTAGTIARNRAWRTEETLWRDVTEKSPGNGRGLMNYGLQLMRQNRLEEARDYFERAHALSPNYNTLEINLGVVYGALGRPAEAEAHFRRALALVDDADGHYYYARWLAQNGRAPDALPHLAASLAISPGFLDARHLDMRLEAASGDDAALRRAAAATLAVDPDDREALTYATGASPYAMPAAQAMTLGLASLSARQFADAAECFRAIVLVDPRSADGWNNLGWAQYELGFLPAARASFTRALEINPSFDRARNNLALAAAKGR